MKANSILRAAALGAGMTILLIGLAVAQTAPTPAPPPVQSAPPAATTPAPAAPPMGRRAIAEACRAEIRADLHGRERREAMRECIAKKREVGAAHPHGGRHEGRHGRHRAMQAVYQDCRKEFAEQRLTETERRDAIQGCMAKKDPHMARMLECRKQADEKKLERGSREFRRHMRACHQGG